MALNGKFVAFGAIAATTNPLVKSINDRSKRNLWDDMMKAGKREGTDTQQLPERLIGIVLRVDGHKMPPPGHFLRAFYKDETDQMNLLHIKVRVPDVHISYPLPDVDLGENDPVIELYPTFVAENIDVEVPDIGSLVVVQFMDKRNLLHPIYIKPLITPIASSGAKIAKAIVQRGSQAYNKVLNNIGLATNSNIRESSLSDPIPSATRPPPSTTETRPQVCSDEVWAAFMELVRLIVDTPVRYGPGRGLFKNEQWIITKGPGTLNSTNWNSEIGGTYPSFHCSSWTNFFLGWLLRYNNDYTHAGNIPPLFSICEKSSDVHSEQKQGWVLKYRGYLPNCTPFLSDGDTRARNKSFGNTNKVVDAVELYRRRDELATFFVCGQSTLKNDKWKWWHHTVLFVVDHRDPNKTMYRLAADGYKSSKGYSGTAMKWKRIDELWVKTNATKAIYRGYSVIADDDDGNYGSGRELRPVVVEL